MAGTGLTFGFTRKLILYVNFVRNKKPSLTCLITLTPLVLFLYAFHLLFVEVVFDVEMFSNFFGRFSPNLIRNGDACIIQEFWNVEKVGGEDNLKKGTLVHFQEFGVPLGKSVVAVAGAIGAILLGGIVLVFL